MTFGMMFYPKNQQPLPFGTLPAQPGGALLGQELLQHLALQICAAPAPSDTKKMVLNPGNKIRE